jgi:hypothetical protein
MTMINYTSAKLEGTLYREAWNFDNPSDGRVGYGLTEDQAVKAYIYAVLNDCTDVTFDDDVARYFRDNDLSHVEVTRFATWSD